MMLLLKYDKKSCPERHDEKKKKEIIPCLQCVHLQNLAGLVVTARGTGNMGQRFFAAFWAGFQERCVPALSASTHFLAALGLTAFWYGHSGVWCR